MEISTYFQFVASHYLAIILFLLISAVVGERLLRRFPLSEDINRIFIYTSIGIGIIIVLLFLIALLNLLYVYTLIIISIIFLIIYVIRKDYIPFLESLSSCYQAFNSFLKRNWFWLIPVFLILSPLFLLPLYPPIKWDEISYHLPYARYYVQHHGLEVNPFLRYPLYSHNIDILYAFSLLVYDDILAHLIHASTAVLTALGVYNLGTITSDKKTGALAGFIFISSPLVIMLTKTAYIDLGLTLYVFLSFYCISLWSIKKQEFWLYLAGFSAGLATGSKYSGLMFIPIFALWIGFEGKRLSSFIRFFVPAVVFGIPWYLRNYLISGDPISPFGGEIFGYWLWNKEDLFSQNKNLFSIYGVPRNLKNLFMLPFNLLFRPGYFMDGSISPLMVLVFPVFLFLKKFNKYYKLLSIFVFINIVIWFFTTQILRYLLPVFPMLSLLSAKFIIYLYDKYSKVFFFNYNPLRDISRRIVSFVFLSLLITPSIYVNYINYDVLRNTLHDDLPVTKRMRDKYLMEKVRAFNLLQIANKTPSLNIYQLGFEDSFYFAKGKMIGDWFGPARYSTVLNLISDSKMLYRKLSSMDIQLFLISKSPEIARNFKELSNEYFDLIAEDEYGWLYRLKT